MDLWTAIKFVHVLAMAFFVGGQLVLAAAVVPVQRGIADKEPMRSMARRFGWGSLIAVGLLIATGSAMAGHYDLWGNGKLHVKLALVGLTAVFVIWHMRRPQMHALEGAVFLLSLAIVWLGLSI